MAATVTVVNGTTTLAADGPFSIDGTIPDAGTTELPDPFGNVKELGPKNINVNALGPGGTVSAGQKVKIVTDS